jgi:hypothetical protein
MKIYRCIENGKVGKDKVHQGAPYKNISFGKYSSDADYARFNLYPEVIVKPEYDSDLFKLGEPTESYDFPTKTIIVEYHAVPKSDSEMKQIAKEEMTAVLEEGFEYNGKNYQCREADMTRWQQGLSLLELTGAEEITVRATDNSMNVLTKVEYKELCLQAGLTYHAELEKYWNDIDVEE